MVPLNLGGVNDLSNLQLLCQKCNLDKLGDAIVASNFHLTFWLKSNKLFRQDKNSWFLLVPRLFKPAILLPLNEALSAIFTVRIAYP